MPPTHILFDNDGVLVDTEKLYYEACRLELESLGVELTHESFAEYSLRRGVSCLDLALERGVLSEAKLAHHKQQRDDRFAALIAAGPCEMSGAREVVHELASRYTLGVVTSAKRVHFELTHAHTDMAQYFAFSYAREDYLRSKPHPDPYLHALRSRSLAPEQCVVVEDSPRGLASALAAGLRCIVVPNPLSPPGAFSQATATLRSLGELPAVLAKLSH